MERLCYVLVLSLFSSILPAQSLPVFSFHEGIWIVDSAMFPADIVKLRVRTDADSIGPYFAYEFIKGGAVKMNYQFPPNRGVCGNGMPVLEKGNWSFTNQTLRIALSGYYVATSQFNFDLEYGVSFPAEGKMKLILTRTYKNEH
jgi:hypothetical protein